MIKIGDLSLDLYNMKLNDVKLTRNEFLIVVKFMTKPNKIITNKEIAVILWGTSEFYQEENIKKYIYRLKKKMLNEGVKENGELYQFLNIRGEGYILLKKSIK